MLRELQSRRSDVVSDLGLVTPCDRRTGRGLTTLKSAPLSLLAKRMHLDVAHVDGFHVTAEDLPVSSATADTRIATADGEAKKWDLLVAVSFGHKLSRCALESSTFGGVNIHPSRLPAYRGAAPLHRALMAGDANTAVSLQTLHPHKFDHGDVLMRSEDIPLQGHTISSLTSLTARIGSDLLKALLLRGYPSNTPAVDTADVAPSYARKLTSEDTNVKWSTMSAETIVRYNRVLERPLWTTIVSSSTRPVLIGKTVKLDGLKPVTLDIVSAAASDVGTLSFVDDRVVIRCIDGYVSPETILVAGKATKLAHLARELDGVVFG